MNARKISKEASGYFENLPKGTQEIVKELLQEYFNNNCDTWHSDIEDVECYARSGFIPHSFNHGGLEVKGFTDLMSIWGSGTYPKHKEARKEIERQIDYSFKMLHESIYDQFENLFKKYKIKKDQVCYHVVEELIKKNPEFRNVLRNIEDGESEALGGTENTIMYSIRFMYHGKLDGLHSASVSVAVNTEGPYHRSRISWAPNVFCEGAKEIEIEWTNQTELKKILKDTLEKICKEVL